MPELSVKVALPPAVTEVGLKAAVAPAGTPDALSDTDCAAPDVTAVEMVVGALPPAVTVTVVGLALMEKSLATTGLMTKLTAVECVAEAPVPVTVIA